MSYSRPTYKLILVATLASLSLGLMSSPAVRAQQSSKSVADSLESGISLYKQGDDREAINILRRVAKKTKQDLQAWHYLGLALQRQGKTSDARKAHEKAAKLGEELLERLLEAGPNEEFPQNLEQFKSQLSDAAASAQKFLELSSKPSTSKVQEWNVRLELLRYYAEMSALSDGNSPTVKVYKASEVSTRARIISKAEPQYTEEARARKVSGTIILLGILASDGTVRAIRVVKGLPHGLNWMAMKAFRRLRFEPALIGDKPVSQYIQVEFNFNIF